VRVSAIRSLFEPFPFVIVGITANKLLLMLRFIF